MSCSNCTSVQHTEVADVCILEVFAGMLVNRGMTAEAALECVNGIDTCALWEDLGPIIDRLQDGDYAQ